MGGDVPPKRGLTICKKSNSPYGRGCSGQGGQHGRSDHEFPVWAGMFRTDAQPLGRPERIPRMGGDVPPTRLLDRHAGRNSPYGRGCSAARGSCPSPLGEFPVWAGMFRCNFRERFPSRRIPRMGGDVPPCSSAAVRYVMNSPYGRGCSAYCANSTAHHAEFPVWAGMFRCRAWPRPHLRRIPRMGGDVPPIVRLPASPLLNSPYGRGCSGPPTDVAGQQGEFPVWAGMFRSWFRLTPANMRIPRMGGDVPGTNCLVDSPTVNSPYGRGCSVVSGSS